MQLTNQAVITRTIIHHPSYIANSFQQVSFFLFDSYDQTSYTIIQIKCYQQIELCKTIANIHLIQGNKFASSNQISALAINFELF